MRAQIGTTIQQKAVCHVLLESPRSRLKSGCRLLSGLLIKKSGGWNYVQTYSVFDGDDESLCASGAFQNQTVEAAGCLSISAERQHRYFFALRLVAQPPVLAGGAYHILTL